MGQVTVTVNGRTYRLQCGNGEEPRLLQLSDYLRQRIDGLSAQFGQVGDERLTIMAALLIADELLDARERIAQLEAQRPNEPPPLPHELPISPPVPAPLLPATELQEPEAAGKRTLRRPTAR